jgi:hypothetical protein
LHPATRDRVLQTVGATRIVVPGLDLSFVPGRVIYDASSGELRFFATAGREGVTCAVTRATLESLTGEELSDRGVSLAVFQKSRNQLEQLLRTRYMNDPVEPGAELRLDLAQFHAIPTVRSAHPPKAGIL